MPVLFMGSSDFDDAALFPGTGIGNLHRIAENAVAHTPQMLGKTPCLQQFLALGGVKDLTCPVDPAAAQTQRVGGIAHIAQRQCAVLHPAAIELRIGQNHDDTGRAVEGVIGRAHDGGIQSGQQIPGFPVPDGHKADTLRVHAAGGIDAGFQHLIQQVIGHLLGPVGADRPAV